MSQAIDATPIEDKSGVTYVPSPTLRLFHRDDSFYRGVMGPFRSGKSTAMVQEILIRSARQAAYNGVRSTRWAIIRNTYPELLSTTIRTWQAWVPQMRCPIKFGAPITGKCRWPAMFGGRRDGTYVDIEIDFLALARPDDKRKLLGTEYTGAWVNEAREIDEDIIDFLARVGSYPYKHHGGATWSGVIMDTNPPHTRSWWYDRFEKRKPEGWKLFRQPGAMLKLPGDRYVPNPDAENIENLAQGYGYYMRQIAGADEDHIKVHVLGEYGNVFAGLPVYKNYYNDTIHKAPQPLGIYRGVPLRLSWDFGSRIPAALLHQVTPSGRFFALKEFVGDNIGLRQLIRQVIKPYLANTYPGVTVISSGADPAGKSRSQHDSDYSCFTVLEEEGYPDEGAPTNEIEPRIQAVRDLLTRTVNGQPAFQLDPEGCPTLREGYIGGYRFAQLQVAGDEAKYRDEPDKNYFSHIHDAQQYGALKASYPGSAGANAGRRAAPTGGNKGGWAGRR